MRLPPGPKNVFEFLSLVWLRKKDPIRFYEEMFRRFGDIAHFKLGPYHFIMLKDPDAIEQVLQTDAKNYSKSSAYQRFKLILGDGLLISEGEKWRRQRRLLSWAFASKHIEAVHPVMVSATLEMLERWEASDKVDLSEEMNQVTLEVISISLFGQSQQENASVLRSSLQEILHYLQTIRHLWLQMLVAPFPVKDKKALALKLEEKLPSAKGRRFFSSIKTIDQLVFRMIKERKQINKQENFLDSLIHATDSEDQSQMDRQTLRDEVMTMLIAGHETTANALTWTWHLLLNHPKAFQKARDEVNQHVEGKAPKFEDLPKLTYLKAIFEESIRLYPPFWRISRKNLTPTTIKGYDIPAGSSVLTAIYNIQRDPNHWERPDDFVPERFLTEKKRHRFAYIPFGAGPRACIGAQFAIAEALTILSICIKHYDFSKDFTSAPSFFVSLTLQPKEGCKVKLKKVQV